MDNCEPLNPVESLAKQALMMGLEVRLALQNERLQKYQQELFDLMRERDYIEARIESRISEIEVVGDELDSLQKRIRQSAGC